MPVIPELGRLRQEYCKFQDNLSNLARPMNKKKKGGEGERWEERR
jgi:hypothetical protein